MTNTESRKSQFIGVTLKPGEADLVDEIAVEKEWTRAQVVRHYFRRGIEIAKVSEKRGEAA